MDSSSGASIKFISGEILAGHVHGRSPFPLSAHEVLLPPILAAAEDGRVGVA